MVNCVSGLHSPHEGLAGGSGQSMSGLAYYQPEHPASAGVVKYPENGHDTLSDFVTFVCQEAENTQQLPQVASVSFFQAVALPWRGRGSAAAALLRPANVIRVPIALDFDEFLDFLVARKSENLYILFLKSRSTET